MISVTRFSGQRFAVNPDLIEQVREIPDTSIVLVDGTTHNVSETYEEVLNLIDAHRSRILATAFRMRNGEATLSEALLHLDPLTPPGAPTRKGGLL